MTCPNVPHRFISWALIAWVKNNLCGQKPEVSWFIVRACLSKLCYKPRNAMLDTRLEQNWSSQSWNFDPYLRNPFPPILYTVLPQV